MDRRKILMIVAIIGLAIGLGMAYKIYNKPHRDIAGEEADFAMDAKALIEEFWADENAANTKYLDKVISVSGTLVDKSASGSDFTLILEDEYDGISARFDSAYALDNFERINKLQAGQKISIKGKCDGMLMMQGVILNKCVLE